MVKIYIDILLKSFTQKAHNYIRYNKTILIFGSSNFFVLIFNSLFSLFILRYVNPEDLGFFNKVLLVSAYIVLLNLSVGVIVQKEVPGLLATNKKNEAFEILQNVKGYFLIILIPITVILIVYLVFSLFSNQFLNSFATLLIITNIWQLIYVNKYLKLLYRTSNEFNNLSKAQFLSSFLYLPSILCLYLFSYLGLYLKHIFIFIFDLVYLSIKAPFKLKPSFNKNKILKILKQSLPIFFVNLFYNYYFILISTFFAFYFDLKTFGFFSLFFLIVNAFNKLIVSIEKVFYVSFSEAVYRKDDLKKTIFNFVKNTLIPFVFFYIVALSIIFYFLNDLIMLFTPKYIDAAGIIKLSLVYVSLLFLKFFNVIYDNLNFQKKKLFSVLIKYIFCLTMILYFMIYDSISPELLIKILIFSELPSFIFNTIFVFKLKST